MKLGLGWKIDEGVPVLPDAKWQENSDKPCDTGSPIATIQSEYPEYNYTSVDPIYPEKVNPPDNLYVFTRAGVLARGQAALAALYSRPEKVIAVVSHSAFLRTSVSQSHYMNADYRIFEYTLDSGKNGEFKLKQWVETEEKGGALGLSRKGLQEIKPTDFPNKAKGEDVPQLPND
ncbi:hypothetical protein EJ05DRAFT_475447 [Pseudovirgaria hyperparasitica]|uniref:Phosphoglycerate mutase-like protein n=1 Tax=Pseudovirgaria hyperparasitica TaxID=470096 RepID=A0A6A6W8L9_9PEZI|nr:uncharacterized protein EJ05DRAFT_475447 [Pseudovirgaria hyperparasitica]KAF2759228.1 hypothetical protein EJ05DRAFT_475447 [Pseudovirgaria hyperparasitica]